jgi:hypothetical protein
MRQHPAIWLAFISSKGAIPAFRERSFARGDGAGAQTERRQTALGEQLPTAVCYGRWIVATCGNWL